MKNKNLLKGQVAFVTGASSGIGQAIAIALGEAGACVGINYHSDEKGARKTLQAIEKAGSKGLVMQGNVGKEEDVLSMFAQLYKKFKTIDILVNNAGIQMDNAFVNMSLAEWEGVINTNLTGSFLCAREAARGFVKQGMQKHSVAMGKMIFISSVHNKIPWAGHANYVASKGGESMLMETIAQELAPQKIRVNSIAPGAIKTDINKKVWSDPAQYAELLKLVPYGRIGEVEDIAKLAVWLASDEADYITGATIYADGGMTLYPSFMHGG